MEKALGLPEIIACIGKYLDRSEILNCIRVQKSWKSELEPLLWRTFTCRPSFDDYGAPSIVPKPNLVLMQQNAHNIRRLFIEEMDPAYHMAFFSQCSQLEEITFIVARTLPRNTQAEQVTWVRFADMIQNHPRLTKIVIEGSLFKTISLSATLMHAIRKCPKLIALEISECTFDSESTEAYLRACCGNIRRVSTRHDEFSSDFNFSSFDLVFPEMRYFDLREITGMSIDTQMEWISRCPNLISLYWESPHLISGSKFCQILEKSCPYLTALHLLLPLIDKEIEQILETIPRVEKLSLTRAQFGRLAFKALRRHFPTLRDINLQLSPEAGSAMIQEILSSCPKLESISGETLSYSDIMKGPWVCQNLQMFDVGIRIAEPNEEGYSRPQDWPLVAHRAVYERLSQLTKLQYLSICNNDDVTEEGLILSLDAGLRRLETLKDLRFFSCKLLLYQTCQRGEAIEVVEWMVQHWKNLESLEGALDMEGVEIAERIVGTVKGHGIQFLDYHEVMDEMDDDYHFEDDDDEDEFYDEFDFTDHEYDEEYFGDLDPDETYLEDLLNNLDMH
ncbi:hypothetical protein BGX27_001354 [Mortierella sp. AM989]|nr:hypothetical protein BGX27_001354 [Mortierella sp. AM989]